MFRSPNAPSACMAAACVALMVVAAALGRAQSPAARGCKDAHDLWGGAFLPSIDAAVVGGVMGVVLWRVGRARRFAQQAARVRRAARLAHASGGLGDTQSAATSRLMSPLGDKSGVAPRGYAPRPSLALSTLAAAGLSDAEDRQHAAAVAASAAAAAATDDELGFRRGGSRRTGEQRSAPAEYLLFPLYLRVFVFIGVVQLGNLATAFVIWVGKMQLGSQSFFHHPPLWARVWVVLTSMLRAWCQLGVALFLAAHDTGHGALTRAVRWSAANAVASVLVPMVALYVLFDVRSSSDSGDSTSAGLFGTPSYALAYSAWMVVAFVAVLRRWQLGASVERYEKPRGRHSVMAVQLYFVAHISLFCIMAAVSAAHLANEADGGDLAGARCMLGLLRRAWSDFNTVVVSWMALLADSTFWLGELIVADTRDPRAATTLLFADDSSLRKVMIAPAELVEVRRDFASGGGGRIGLYRYGGQPVAVKTLYREEIAKDYYDTFAREARAMANLSHPHIVSLVGVCLDPPNLRIAMEYCHRGSLFHLVKRAVGSPATRANFDAVALARDVAAGMAYMHENRVLHLDLKSLNVLVTRDWRAKIGDFGEVHWLQAGQEGLTPEQLDRVGGSAPWMAPELFGRRSVGFAADVYSFGVLLWEALTWRLPFLRLPKAALSFAERAAPQHGDSASNATFGGRWPGFPATFRDILRGGWEGRGGLASPPGSDALDAPGGGAAGREPAGWGEGASYSAVVESHVAAAAGDEAAMADGGALHAWMNASSEAIPGHGVGAGAVRPGQLPTASSDRHLATRSSLRQPLLLLAGRGKDGKPHGRPGDRSTAAVANFGPHAGGRATGVGSMTLRRAALVDWPFERSHVAAVLVDDEGMRPPIPTACPHQLAHLIARCWDARPERRPSFASIVAELESMEALGRQLRARLPLMP